MVKYYIIIINHNIFEFLLSKNEGFCLVFGLTTGETNPFPHSQPFHTTAALKDGSNH